MKRIGIGGVQLADVGFRVGQSIDQKVQYGREGWLELVRFAASKADELDLEMAIFSSPGWGITGSCLITAPVQRYPSILPLSSTKNRS